MKVIGKHSLIYWLRYPLLLYVILFLLSSLWMGMLIIYYFFTRNENAYISVCANSSETSLAVVNFHYPFSNMVLATEHSGEGMLLALLGIGSISFILIYVVRIAFRLSEEAIFTAHIVRNFKTLAIGLIVLGVFILLADILIGKSRMDFTPPFFYILIGVILLFIKEIFAKGQQLQEQTDLTI